MSNSSIKLQIGSMRKKKGVTQEELAKHLGVSFQAVSKWETGTTYPDITLLPLIADYFNESVDSVLGLQPVKKEPKELYDSIKNCLSNLDKDKLYTTAWNISGVLHEALTTDGWKGYAHWDTARNRLEDNSYSNWGLSMHCNDKGFTHMTSGFTIIGSMDDITIPTPEKAISIARYFEMFQDKSFMRLLLICYEFIKQKGIEKPFSHSEILDACKCSDDMANDFIKKMTSLKILNEQFSPDGLETEYYLNQGWLIIPIILLGDIFANKLNS